MSRKKPKNLELKKLRAVAEQKAQQRDPNIDHLRRVVAGLSASSLQTASRNLEPWVTSRALSEGAAELLRPLIAARIEATGSTPPPAGPKVTASTPPTAGPKVTASTVGSTPASAASAPSGKGSELKITDKRSGATRVSRGVSADRSEQPAVAAASSGTAPGVTTKKPSGKAGAGRSSSSRARQPRGGGPRRTGRTSEGRW